MPEGSRISIGTCSIPICSASSTRVRSCSSARSRTRWAGAVAYRRKYVEDLFDHFEPKYGDDLTNSEDIFIGLALIDKGYRNVQLTDVCARTVEPPFYRLPRQVYMWSSAFLQACYYFDPLVKGPLKSVRRLGTRLGQKNPPLAPAAPPAPSTEDGAERAGASDRPKELTGRERRRIAEPYRQAFGRDFTAAFGRPAGWMLLMSAMEKVFLPTTLFILIVLGYWEALAVTLAAETGVGIACLMMVMKGQRLEYFFKGLLVAPIRYVMLLLELPTMGIFAVQLWVTKDPRWAQVSPMRLVAAAGLLVCLCSAAFAQTDLPPAALAAESEGQWEVALRLYHDLLAQQPTRADVWVRAADIEARLGNADAALADLRAAAAVDRENPELHVRLSQAYAAVDSPARALQSIDRALAQRPTDPEYLRAGAVLATWTGDYETAYKRYRKLQALEPADATVLLDLAHVSAWSGQTTQAIDAYRLYLEQQPDAAEAWLELATAESWRGNYAAALDALGEHRDRFGSSRAHSLALGRVLAGAGRPTRAVDVLEPLWQQDPDDYVVNLTRTTAFTMQGSIGQAYEALATVRRAQPDSPETRNAERLVRATLGSSIGPTGSFYADSDDLQVITLAPAASLRLKSGTEITAGYGRSEFRAPRDGGLGTLTGDTAYLEHTWGGLAQAVGGFTVSGRVGSARAEGQRLIEHAFGVRWRASDTFEVGAEREFGFVGISPRTVELGLTEQRNSIDARWTPTVRTTVDLEGAYSDLSDDNRRWEVRVSPRHAVVRSQWVNLDLAASAYRLETTRDLSNGYYDPRRYEAVVSQNSADVCRRPRNKINVICWSSATVPARR